MSPVVVVSVVVAESGRFVVVVLSSASSPSPRVVDVVEPVVVVPGWEVVVVPGREVVVVDGRVVVVGRTVVVVVGGLVVVVVVGIWAEASPGQARIETLARAANNPRPAHLRSEHAFDNFGAVRAPAEVRGWGPSSTR